MRVLVPGTRHTYHRPQAAAELCERTTRRDRSRPVSTSAAVPTRGAAYPAPALCTAVPPPAPLLPAAREPSPARRWTPYRVLCKDQEERNRQREQANPLYPHSKRT